MWPDYTFRYRRRVDRFDIADYDIEPATRSPAAATTA
jgi:hypothetical protein